MQTKSIVAAAAIALIAGVGSVSADELSVADTANDTEAPFAMLDGIATEQMSVQELAATRGAVVVLLIPIMLDYSAISSDITTDSTTILYSYRTYKFLIK